MVEHNRDIRTARPLQTDMGERQTETDSVRREQIPWKAFKVQHRNLLLFTRTHNWSCVREASLFMSCRYLHSHMKIIEFLGDFI